MKEDFLHFIWQYKKFNIFHLQTTQHEPLEIISGGIINFHSGPDFFNGKLRIGEQLWAGNIEIHIKSSNWFLHGHEKDSAYDNVILHVVYEHDAEIFRRDNTIIPTLELKNYIDNELLYNYHKLFSVKKSWINCEKHFAQVPEFILKNWLERLYFERLESKSETIEDLLLSTKNDWEAVLFQLLAKNFGLKVNGDSFFSLANSFDFSVFRKLRSNLVSLEALLFGQSGLLDKEIHNSYYINLQKEYRFLKQKFQLSSQGVLPLQFFRLRPANFPTIRLSQLANLFQREQQLFSRIIEINQLSSFYALFKTQTSPFWDTHYTFDKSSKVSIKKTSKSFIDLLLINTILPLKFYFAKQNGQLIDEVIINLIQGIASEKNSIVDMFTQINYKTKTALESQALIQLKTEYCDKNRCLKCAVGNSLLTK